MAVNIHITIIELNALHTKRQNLFQELDAVIHLLMEAKHWGLRKSRNATSLNSRFKSLDTLKVKIISVTFRRVIRTNHLPQLDINNTIDHRPEGDEKWFLENEKTVTQFCRKLAAERSLKDIRDEYNYPKKKGIKDECSRLLEASTMKSRRGFAIQRLMNAMRQAHADGWFI